MHGGSYFAVNGAGLNALLTPNPLALIGSPFYKILRPERLAEFGKPRVGDIVRYIVNIPALGLYGVFFGEADKLLLIPDFVIAA
jgi:hypothetical protein